MGGKKEAGPRKPRPVQPAASPVYSLARAAISVPEASSSSSSSHHTTTTTTTTSSLFPSHSFMTTLTIPTTALHNDRDALTFAALKKVLHKPLAEFRSSGEVEGNAAATEVTPSELIVDVTAIEAQVDTLRHKSGRAVCTVEVLLTVTSACFPSCGVLAGVVEALPYRETARVSIVDASSSSSSSSKVVLARCLDSEPLSIGQTVLLSIAPSGVVCFRMAVGGAAPRSSWKDLTAESAAPTAPVGRTGAHNAPLQWQALQIKFTGRLEQLDKDGNQRSSLRSGGANHDEGAAFLRPTRMVEPTDRRQIVPAAASAAKRPRSGDEESSDEESKQSTTKPPLPRRGRDDGGDSDASDNDDAPLSVAPQQQKQRNAAQQATSAAAPKPVISVKRTVSKYHNAVPAFEADGKTKMAATNVTKFDDSDSD